MKLSLKKEIYKRITSLITVCAFLANTVMADFAWALGAPRIEQYNACKIEVPFRFGSIEESYIGTNGKTVIHIQDAHCNYSCQESIKNLLGHLTDKYGVDLALLEGGAGNYDLSVFTDIEDRSLRTETADYFVKQGRVNGAENFAINNPEKITLKGLENKNLYLNNLQKYRDTLVYRNEAEKILKDKERELSALKLNVYSDELKELDQKKNDFYDKEIEIDEYLAHLALLSDSRNIDLTIHKNLGKLINVIRREKNIDFNRSNSERDELIDELSRRLSSMELETFVKKTVQFKREEIKAQEFYSYLFKKAETTGINAKKNYPNLSKYGKYAEIYETLDSKDLFDEIEALEEEIFSTLCENEAQKELNTFSKNLTILKKLFNVTLTPQEYKYYQKNRDSFDLARFLSSTKNEEPKCIKRDSRLRGNDKRGGDDEQGGNDSRFFVPFPSPLSFPRRRESHTIISTNITPLNTYRTKMEEFYTLAFKRDTAFLKNIKTSLKNKDKLIIVTGGFHAENLKALLKEKGYSYFSIMPELDKEDEENPYFRLLSGGLLEEERIVTQAMSSITLGSMFDEMPEVPLGDDSICREAVRLRAASKGGKVSASHLESEFGANDNVTCGTVCRRGHEACIGALDDQLEEFYEGLAKDAGIVRNLKTDPLRSDEVLSALIQTGRIKSDTAELLKRVKKNLEEIEENGIQILFAIPKDKTKLWWVKDPKTGEWTYAGGHFNGKGTRIHISIPLILSQDDPEEAAQAIAMHDYNHIIGGVGHDDADEGMRIVGKSAEEENEKIIRKDRPIQSIQKKGGGFAGCMKAGLSKYFGIGPLSQEELLRQFDRALRPFDEHKCRKLIKRTRQLKTKLALNTLAEMSQLNKSDNMQYAIEKEAERYNVELDSLISAYPRFGNIDPVLEDNGAFGEIFRHILETNPSKFSKKLQRIVREIGRRIQLELRGEYGDNISVSATLRGSGLKGYAHYIPFSGESSDLEMCIVIWGICEYDDFNTTCGIWQKIKKITRDVMREEGDTTTFTEFSPEATYIIYAEDAVDKVCFATPNVEEYEGRDLLQGKSAGGLGGLFTIPAGGPNWSNKIAMLFAPYLYVDNPERLMELRYAVSEEIINGVENTPVFNEKEIENWKTVWPYIQKKWGWQINLDKAREGRGLPKGRRILELPELELVLKEITAVLKKTRNVSCGTVCRRGHEACVGALDDQLEEFYEDLAKKAGITRNLKTYPLTSDEVLSALIQTGRIKSDTAELLKRIKANLEEIEEKGIQILFAVPTGKTKLWWVKDPKTGEWTYAGGHFNGNGTRIHISLPLILSQEDPEEAAQAIAMHDYKHIVGEGHDEKDEGMKIVTHTAVLERDWENVIKKRSISAKLDKDKDDFYDRFKEELILIEQAISSIFSGEMFDDVDEMSLESVSRRNTICTDPRVREDDMGVFCDRPPLKADDTNSQTVVMPETEHKWLSVEVVKENSLLQWAEHKWGNIVIIVGCIIGICFLLPRLVTKIRKGGHYPVNIHQKAHQERKGYNRKRVASQLIDPSLVPKPRYEETVTKKFPKNWNSDIDLSVTKSSGIGRTIPYDAPLANETIVAGIEGTIYDPLFKTVAFNFKSNGEIVPPADLKYIPAGAPDGTSGTFKYQINAKGESSIEPVTHLKGIIDPASIKIRPLGKDGILLDETDVPFNLESGRIIEFDYEGRVRVELQIVNYYENVVPSHTQAPLPENEIRDFPDAFAMDIIKYTREGLAWDEDLSAKFVQLVDADEMTLREKLDAIADPERSGFIPERVKFQANVNVMNKYCLINPRNAKMKHNGRSWGSTWNAYIESGQKIRLICNTSSRMFVLLCQRVGLQAGYVADSEGLGRKGNFIIKSKIPHAKAVVLQDGKWKLVETTGFAPKEADIVASFGGNVFEEEVEYVSPADGFWIEPNNHEEEQELRKRDTIIQELEKLKRRNNRGSVHWWLNMGIKYNEAGYGDEAVECFMKGFSIDPNEIMNGYYRYQFIETCKNQGDLTATIEYIQGYLEQNPKSKGSSDILCDLWELYQDAGETEKALDFLESFVGKDPKNSLAWWLLKKGYLNQTKIKGMEQSIKFLDKYLKKHPKNDEGLRALREICKEEGNIDSSIEEIKKLLNSRYNKRKLKKSSKTPRPFWLYDVLGDLYVRRKLPDKAMAAYEQAFAFSPAKVKFWSRAGFEFYDNDYSKQSVKAYEEALRFEANRSDGNLWKYLGYSYRSTGDYDKAIEAYKKALGISVDLYFERRIPVLYAIYDLTDIYKNHAPGRIDEAIEYFRELSNENPEKPRVTMALARLYTSKGNYNKAIKAYKQGMKPILDEKYCSDEVKELAKIYVKHIPERIDDGITYLEMLRGEYPVHSGVNDALASLYMAKKLFDKAIDLHKRRITLILDEERRYNEYAVSLLLNVYLDHRKEKISEGIDYFRKLLEKVSNNEHKNDVMISIAKLYMGKQDFKNALLWYRKVIEPEVEEILKKEELYKRMKDGDLKKSYEETALMENVIQASLPELEKVTAQNYDSYDLLGFIECLIGAKEYYEAEEACLNYLRMTRAEGYYDFARGWEKLRDIYKLLDEDKKAESADRYYYKYIDTPPPGRKELGRILKEFRRSDELKEKQNANDNVSCGTICQPGHEACIGALDDQLEEFYEGLAKDVGITRNLKTDPLTSDEVIDALVKTGRIKSDTAELLKRIEANLEEIEEKGIQILFAIPKDNAKLWWVKDPKTGEWTYAGGHFNEKGTRIHISIPLILSQDNPEEVALAIAKHDYNHIIGKGHDEDDEGMRIVKKFAGWKRTGSSNRFMDVLTEEGPYRSMKEFFEEDAQATYFGIRPFWGHIQLTDTPMGKVHRICDEAAKKWVDSIKEKKTLPPVMSSDVFEPEKQLMLDMLEEVTRKIYPELGTQVCDNVFGRRQVVYMLNWTFQKAKAIFPDMKDCVKTKELAPQADKLLSFEDVKNNEPIKPTMNPSYIIETAEKMLETLTGENGTERASCMAEPCTIGMVIKAEPGRDLDTVLKKNLANEWNIISRKVNLKVAIKRGVQVGNVTYVICVDDGTDKCLETFADNLKKAGNLKERTFAWMLSNKKRKEKDNRYMKALNEAAYVVGLEGEYIPVSWQMLAGRLFADYIDSKTRSDNTEEFQERIDAIVEGIIKSLSLMTKMDFEKWDDDLGKKLRSASLTDIRQLFNGVSLVLDLPAMEPVTSNLAQYQKADKKIQSSL